jgi:TnpA family transposase
VHADTHGQSAAVFALALQELGKAVRTTFLLDWIVKDSMRRAVHKCTTKIERHHKFGREGSAVMMDGTMTVPDDGGKPIVEER